MRRRREVARRRADLARVLEEHSPPYRVNVGSGRMELAGWINTDVDRVRPYLDATKPWPMPAGSVGHVFSDNMIEHLKLDQARAFLREAHRAMAPGGRIRIVTPDPEGVARAYLLDAEAAEAMTERHRRGGYRMEHRVDLLRVIYHESGHCQGYLFDEAALRFELEAAGFRDVVRAELGRSTDPVLTGLDTRTGPGDASLLLAIEAIA